MKAQINGTEVSISKLKYLNNRIALTAETPFEPYAVLTVNLPFVDLEPEEGAIDVNNLGMGIISQLVDQGITQPPRPEKWAKSGYVDYPICKILI